MYFENSYRALQNSDAKRGRSKRGGGVEVIWEAKVYKGKVRSGGVGWERSHGSNSEGARGEKGRGRKTDIGGKGMEGTDGGKRGRVSWEG